MGLSHTMYINDTHRYSHLGDILLRLTYGALGVHLIGAIEFYEFCARSKSIAHAVRKKTYTQAENLAEKIFVDTAGPLLEILIW